MATPATTGCRGAGNDLLHGGLGSDTIFGQDGDDRIFAQAEEYEVAAEASTFCPEVPATISSRPPTRRAPSMTARATTRSCSAWGTSTCRPFLG
ncbi:hypothetical protein [Geminicoccus flavidas]|uniref:hypothetical protein n=1 Tax=Geminicoccus flavidas TaxID=2506407 RepID=UPI0013597002